MSSPARVRMLVKFHLIRQLIRSLLRSRHSSSITNINDLPDECILLILSHLPLIELLLTVPLVCSRWATLQPSAVRSRRSMLLMLGRNPLELYTWSRFMSPFLDHFISSSDTSRIPLPLYRDECNELNFHHLSSKLTKQILDNFPRIDHFELVIRHLDSNIIEQIVKLLEIWSNSLIHFKVWTHFVERSKFLEHDQISFNISRLLDTLIQLKHVQHLTLHFDNFVFSEQLDNVGTKNYSKILKLKSLKHVTEFYFHSLDHVRILRFSLGRYAEFNANLKLNLIHLSLTIQSLDFYESNPIYESTDHQSHINPLSAVKALDLTIQTEYHSQLYALKLGQTFPGLQSMHIYDQRWRCLNCSQIDSTSKPINNRQSNNGRTLTANNNGSILNICTRKLIEKTVIDYCVDLCKVSLSMEYSH
ncbi:hypothetical protein RDWZM_005246 [Blomia tropicalis]|uniref:F-box domain-containing protein n=1 Tax=Blomia tropicalis TaxID=40697 RepID=A0A9Q0M5X4_BLOTA|nr:hypothetical protein RDWZM_005246 [Blomia tropicalis]